MRFGFGERVADSSWSYSVDYSLCMCVVGGYELGLGGSNLS